MISISSAIAITALFAGVFAYQTKNDNHLKFILFLQALLLGTHYAMEGSYSASIITFTIAPLNLLSIYRNTRTLYPVFAVLVLVAGAIGYNGPQDLFPIASITLSLFALNKLEGIHMRMALMMCSLMWIIHDVAYDLPIILVMDIALFLSNGLGIIRLIREQEQAKKSEEPGIDAQALHAEST